MGAMSYMAKTHLEQQPVSYDGDREARIKATKDHFKHLLLKTTCLCEKRGVVMAIGMKKGIGDVARSAVAGVKGAVQGAKQGIQDARKPESQTMYSTRHGQISSTDPKYPSANKTGMSPSSTPETKYQTRHGQISATDPKYPSDPSKTPTPLKPETTKTNDSSNV